MWYLTLCYKYVDKFIKTMFIREGIFRRATRHNLGPLPVQNADLQKYIIDRQVIFSQNSYFTL